MTDFKPKPVSALAWAEYQSNGWVKSIDLAGEMGIIKYRVSDTIRRHAEHFPSAIKIFGVGAPFIAINKNDAKNWKKNSAKYIAEKRRLSLIAAYELKKLEQVDVQKQNESLNVVLSAFGVYYAG